MTESIENLAGKCVCGAVQVSVQTAKTQVGACHCSICRNWGGGPLLAADCGTRVTFSNNDKVGRYQSSDWAERGFCLQCGSHLFYHLLINDQYIMPVGLFADNLPWQFDHQIFIDEKPNYYCFANDTAMMTGEEVFAAFNNE